MELFGIRFVGVNAENGQKLLLSLIFLVVILGVRWLLRRLLQAMYRRRPSERLRFWARQGVAIATTVLLVMGWLSIWFDNPTRLAAALGLITAGLAFALQRVVTALAGYVVILRGDLFTAGDRITMGGVRGDVIGLGFTTTQIFEMGQPPSDQEGSPPTWIRSRQPTGRVEIESRNLHQAEFDLFIDALEQDKAPPYGFIAGKQMLAMTIAIHESIATGKEVPVFYDF